MNQTGASSDSSTDGEALQHSGLRTGVPLSAPLQIPFSNFVSREQFEQQQQQDKQTETLNKLLLVQTIMKNRQMKSEVDDLKASCFPSCFSQKNILNASPIIRQSVANKASRHRDVEKRRRRRIKERLDQLRGIVPHSKDSTTASFLEQALTYVVKLQNKSDSCPGDGDNGQSHPSKKPSFNKVETETDYTKRTKTE